MAIGVSFNLAACLMLSATLSAQAAPDKAPPSGAEVKVAQFTAPTPGGVFLFPKAPNQRFEAVLQNTAPIKRSVYFKVQITDYNDKAWLRLEGEAVLEPSSSQKLAVAFDSSKWPLGPYDGAIGLYLDKNATTPVSTQNLRMGIVSNTVLEKARPGEFLYGLDPANSDIFPIYGPNAFAFYRAMGVDLLRNIFDKGMPQTAESVGQCLKLLTPENLQASVMIDPPSPRLQPAQRDAVLAKKETVLEEIGRLYCGTGVGKVHFFELGNEPDLGFYPGPIPDYIASIEAMSDAVKSGARKAGLPDSATAVMNGGLAFFHESGEARAREYLEKFDPKKVNIIAYHGHGPGIQAERSAYERVHSAASKFGKGGMPFMETESGYSGDGRVGLLVQARTAVEKLVYGQSVGLPALMFFRLFMEGSGVEGGYGLTDNFLEPHPAVLTYRNTVEQLRHHRFIKKLDFPDADGVDAFLFAEQDANGKATGRKVMVAFSEKPARANLLLRLDNSKAKVETAAVVDMYGNSTPANLITGNIATVSVGLDPIYLAWSSPGEAGAVAIATPLLGIHVSDALLAGAGTPIALTLRSPEQKPLEVELTMDVQARLPVKAEPAKTTVTIAPDQAVQLPVIVQTGASTDTLRLPMWWKVFLNLDHDRFTPALAAAIPDELPGKSGTVAGQFTWASGNHIDFGKLAGGIAEKRAAVAYSIVDSPSAIDLPCAASADWWMAWYVNGVKVFDTLDKGNLGSSIASHPFTLPLKKGRNIIVVEVLSGSGGWSLDFGGPKERQIALTGGNDPDHVTVIMTAAGKVLARDTASLQVQGPVPPLGDINDTAKLENWMPLEPLAVLDAAAAHNLWMKAPDQSRWYGGGKDLSAIVWLRDDGEKLHLFAAVTDDKLVQATAPEKLPQCDSLRVVIANDQGKPIADSTVGLVNNSAALIGTKLANVSVARQEKPGEGPATLYHVTMPRSTLGTQPLRLSLSIADNDAGYLKQTLDLGDVSNPINGDRFILAR